jgi:hypothetical protein
MHLVLLLDHSTCASQCLSARHLEIGLYSGSAVGQESVREGEHEGDEALDGWRHMNAILGFDTEALPNTAIGDKRCVMTPAPDKT